MNALGNH